MSNTDSVRPADPQREEILIEEEDAPVPAVASAIVRIPAELVVQDAASGALSWQCYMNCGYVPLVAYKMPDCCPHVVVCKECIERQIAATGAWSCPQCHKAYGTHLPRYPDPHVSSFVSHVLRMKCPHEGCNAIYTPGTLGVHHAQHLQMCPTRPVPCPFCNAEVPKNNIVLHKASCPQRTDACPHCSEQVPIGQMRAHRNSPVEGAKCVNMKKCPNGCAFNESDEPPTKKQHRAAAAAAASALSCSFFAPDELKEHLLVCPLREVECPEGCGEVFKGDEALDRHRRSATAMNKHRAILREDLHRAILEIRHLNAKVGALSARGMADGFACIFEGIDFVPKACVLNEGRVRSELKFKTAVLPSQLKNVQLIFNVGSQQDVMKAELLIDGQPGPRKEYMAMLMLCRPRVDGDTEAPGELCTNTHRARDDRVLFEYKFVMGGEHMGVPVFEDSSASGCWFKHRANDRWMVHRNKKRRMGGEEVEGTPMFALCLRIGMRA